MIKKPETNKIVQRFEYYICTNSGRRYEFKWRSRIRQYYTCGCESVEVDCQEIIPETLEIFPFSSTTGMATHITLQGFNELHPEEQIDLNCNCHGFAFSNGKYTICNEYVDKILAEEFTRATAEQIQSHNYDLVIFRDAKGEPIHSCRFQYDLYTHKEGIRKYTTHRTLEEILALDEYKKSTVDFYRRNSRSCPGMCHHAINHKSETTAEMVQHLTNH